MGIVQQYSEVGGSRGRGMKITKGASGEVGKGCVEAGKRGCVAR